MEKVNIVLSQENLPPSLALAQFSYNFSHWNTSTSDESRRTFSFRIKSTDDFLHPVFGVKGNHFLPTLHIKGHQPGTSQEIFVVVLDGAFGSGHPR